MSLHFCMHEVLNFEHTNAKCHLCTLQSSCRPLCNIGIHTHNTIKQYLCTNIRVEAPVTDYLKDYVPNLEKYVALQVAPI
jgi:L-lactate utilization protein LutB